MHLRLWNNDTLGGCNCEVCGESTTKPDTQFLYRLARYDELAIGTEKLLARELRLQCLKCKIKVKFVAIVAVGSNALLEGVYKGYIFGLERYDFVAEMD